MTQLNTNLPAQNSDQEQPFQDLQRSINKLQQFSLHQLQLHVVLRWIGYGFLLLFLFDLIEILYPPQFMNPAWEFQTLGQLVERVPIPLLGFALVIMGGHDANPRIKRPFLKVVSWSALVLALAFYLGIPLGIFDTIRLNQQLNAQFTTQVEQPMANVQQQVQTVKTQIKQVNTATDLQALLEQLEFQEQLPDIQSSSQLTTVKEQLVASLDNRVAGMEYRAKTELASQRQQLWMRSVKWNLGALVSGTLFFLIWKEMRWARSSK